MASEESLLTGGDQGETDGANTQSTDPESALSRMKVWELQSWFRKHDRYLLKAAQEDAYISDGKSTDIAGSVSHAHNAAVMQLLQKGDKHLVCLLHKGSRYALCKNPDVRREDKGANLDGFSYIDNYFQWKGLSNSGAPPANSVLMEFTLKTCSEPERKKRGWFSLSSVITEDRSGEQGDREEPKEKELYLGLGREKLKFHELIANDGKIKGPFDEGAYEALCRVPVPFCKCKREDFTFWLGIVGTMTGIIGTAVSVYNLIYRLVHLE